MKSYALVSLAIASLCSTFALADNWPHWRGEQGNGVSLTAKPPVRWSPTQNVKWKTPIAGRGSGSPIVWEDRIFVTTAVGGSGTEVTEMDFQLLCIDRRTGQPLWTKTAITATPHAGTHRTNSFASASPCTDGDRVFAHFGSRGLYCFTLDGQLLWKRDDLGLMQTRAGFGEGSSPTLAGERIIVPWDHEGDSYIAALEKATGETIWKTPRDEPTCWATPLVVRFQGREQVIMNGQTSARSYDLETGEELWRCPGQTQRPAASAVSNGVLAFIGSGFRGSFLGAFQLDGRGNLEGTPHVAWTTDHDTPDVASPVLSENRLYFYKGRSGVITCLNAKTGQPFFERKRLNGLDSIYASPVAANGYVYLSGRNGNTVVLKDATTFEVVAENSLGETIDATPAPVDNELIIRGERHLFCLSEQ